MNSRKIQRNRFVFPRSWFGLSLLAGLFGCASPSNQAGKVLVAGEANAPSQVTPGEAMALAQRFVNHPWRPFARNILHGPDRAGVVVQTPDIGMQTERPGWWLPGEFNLGLPYKWGGFDEPATFDQAIASGAAGGDVSTPAKRRADNAAVSASAAGVDCSGFVSRCLKLPKVHDTTQLPDVCTVLANPLDLRPGDLLNIPHRHVILCAGWASADKKWIYYYETGGPPDYWKPGLKNAPLEELLALGYVPLRYRGMAYQPQSSGKEVLTRSAISRAALVAHPTIGEP